jgi:multimeric flavodoxin WrbA
MNLLGISGSPRPKGNTSYLLSTVADAAQKTGATVTLLTLCDLNIADCDGCMVCERTDCRGDCSIQDDMDSIVVPALLSADALILGTPTYFDLPSAQLKRFMDRTNMILNQLADRSLTVGIIVVGQSELSSLQYAHSAVRRFCDICKMREVEGSPVFAIARDIGDAAGNSVAVQAARRLARELCQVDIG